MTKRQRQNELKRYVVTEEDVLTRLPQVIEMCNDVDGPKVFFDPVRGWGLFADRDYRAGEKVTSYGGYVAMHEVRGDYVAHCNEVHVNGYHGFEIFEKGRFINEKDAERSVVNVQLGRTIRTVKAVSKGEQFFADYGNEYNRSY